VPSSCTLCWIFRTTYTPSSISSRACFRMATVVDLLECRSRYGHDLRSDHPLLRTGISVQAWSARFPGVGDHGMYETMDVRQPGRPLCCFPCGEVVRTIDFLGFTHYCSRSRDGKRFRMKRKTARARLRAKLAAFKEWLKAYRARMTNRELWAIACKKLRGHYAYYGVSDNSEGIMRFAYEGTKAAV